jgi:hypothetical protein
MGEAIVSADGRRIVCRPDRETPPESFHVYLLGQALSFALLKLGFEPLHATAVVVDGRAVGLLGDSGNGKSTLAAGFIDAGFAVLTDDVLVVHAREGQALAFPGPPRLKLFPKVAERLVADLGRASRMNGDTAKLVVPLEDPQVHNRPVPIAALYELAAPAGAPGARDVRIERMSGREAALALVRGAFNQRLVTRDRLTRQFAAAAGLAEIVEVRRLSYPRLFSRLPDVVGAILADIEVERREGETCVQQW